ncbi:MAG: hypothetical protein INF91_01630 [Alphaproteobacteria bacterium]|nr:hypothetical protein [Alphaproteobacteria bacterium]
MITFLPDDPQIEAFRGGTLKRVCRRSNWSAATEDAFLLALADSCNVRRSAERAGLSKMSAYHRRRTNPEFAARWEAALAIGHDRMKEALLRADVEDMQRRAAARAAFPGFFNPDTPMPKMTAEDAIRQLKLHRWSLGRGGKRPGPKIGPRPKPMSELAEGIQRKIAAVRRMREMRNAKTDATERQD